MLRLDTSEAGELRFFFVLSAYIARRIVFASEAFSFLNSSAQLNHNSPCTSHGSPLADVSSSSTRDVATPWAENKKTDASPLLAPNIVTLSCRRPFHVRIFLATVAEFFCLQSPSSEDIRSPGSTSKKRKFLDPLSYNRLTSSNILSTFPLRAAPLLQVLNPSISFGLAYAYSRSLLAVVQADCKH